MYHSLQWTFYQYRTLVLNSLPCQSAQCLRSICEWCHQFSLTEEEGQVGIILDNKILTIVVPEGEELLVSRPTQAPLKQDARRHIELPNTGKEDTAYTTM